jgi:hypothetical protein
MLSFRDAEIVMNHILFWKYTSLAVIFQLVLCILVWIMALWLSNWREAQFLFGAMFYFYYPTTYLLYRIHDSPGFGGQIVFGMLLGMLVYGVLFGAVIGFVRRHQSI